MAESQNGMEVYREKIGDCANIASLPKFIQYQDNNFEPALYFIARYDNFHYADHRRIRKLYYYAGHGQHS